MSTFVDEPVPDELWSEVESEMTNLFDRVPDERTPFILGNSTYATMITPYGSVYESVQETTVIGPKYDSLSLTPKHRV